MKFFNYFFCFVFIVFAALQYNDPDPYVWIPIYMYAAVLCWLAARGKTYPGAYWLGIAVYAAYAAFLFFTRNGVLDWAEEHHAESLVQQMKADKPWIEDTREFGGLLILIVVLLIDYFYSRKLRKRTAL